MPGSTPPSKSWNFNLKFPGLENPEKNHRIQTHDSWCLILFILFQLSEQITGLFESDFQDFSGFFQTCKL